MRNLLRRVEILENSVYKNRTSQLHRIRQKALEHLSMEELECLARIARERKQGAPPRELSAQERAALEASTAALELEVRVAGFDSVSEFKLSCGENQVW
jgi:RNA polymerase-interacting CarD/CdnL/TRCF family regulator